jgi:putative peptidoglycan lipid II flippase
MVTARAFGAGTALDSYLVAFLLPSFLTDVFCGALVPALVPALMELDHRKGRLGVTALYDRIMNLCLVCSLGASALLAAGAIAAARREHLRMAANLVLLMIPILPFTAVANIWRAVLNAQRRFAAPAAAAALTPLVIVLSVLVGFRAAGIWALAAGTSVGALAEVAFLAAAMGREGFPILPRWTRSTTHMGSLPKEYGYLAATAAVSAGGFFIGQAMAASAGTGSVSIFNYGTRLQSMLLAIGPAALSVTALPHFSQLAADRAWGALRRSLRNLLFGSTGIAGAVSLVLILCSFPIVRLALQRGAFTAADTSAVAEVQAYSLLQLPFVVGVAILTRMIAAVRANRVLLPLSGATLAVNSGLNYVLMMRCGIAGIALSGAVTQAMLFAVLLALVFFRGQQYVLMESGEQR